MIVKNGKLYPGISNFTTNLNIPDIPPHWTIHEKATVKYQIIVGAFICFNHLTDQAFIWDQAAIWNRRLKFLSLKNPR